MTEDRGLAADHGRVEAVDPVGPLQQLPQTILSALGIADIRLVQEGGQRRLLIARADAAGISLSAILDQLSPPPPLTGVLGVEEGGRPLLLPLSAGNVPHLLLAGSSGAGKSSLLRTFLFSLALGSRQSQCQFLVIDPQIGRGGQRRELAPVAHLPHMLAPPARDPAAISTLFSFLGEELAFRRETGHQSPAIFTTIESVVAVLEMGGTEQTELLGLLLQEGPAVGLHFLLTTRRPYAPLVTGHVQPYLPLRIYAQEQDVQAVGAARPAMREFVAQMDGSTTWFQAAYVGRSEAHILLSQVRRRAVPILLAQPLPEEAPTDVSERITAAEIGAPPWELADEAMVHADDDSVESRHGVQAARLGDREEHGDGEKRDGGETAVETAVEKPI